MWLITGAGGQLGSVVMRELAARGVPCVALTSLAGPAPAGAHVLRLDLADRAALAAELTRLAPTHIVHTAALSSVAACHTDPTLAERINVLATGHLAELARALGARFVYTSTDMVFDGESAPYSESAPPRPLSCYGRSKAAGEEAALRGSNALVVRFPLLYGLPAVPRETTFRSQVRALERGEPLALFNDEIRTPLALEDAARALLRAAESSVRGVLHAGGPERLSRLAMGELLARALGVTGSNIQAVSRLSAPSAEPRPRDLSLDSSLYESTFGAAPGRPMADALVNALS